MTNTMKIEQRRRAMLIQALEARWPGCGAHSKRDQVTGRNDIVVSDLLAPAALGEIRAFLAGWDAGGAALLACLQGDAPFPDADTAALQRGQRHQNAAGKPGARRPGPAVMDRRTRNRCDAAAEAQAGLAALFSGGGGDQE